MKSLQKNDSDMFFTCSLIELIGRQTLQKRSEVVKCMGHDILEHIFEMADVLHCEPIAKTADTFIELCKISTGTYDNVGECKYTVPTYWDIGKVYARLIEDENKGDAVATLMEVFTSGIEEMISNFNSDFFYQNRGFIKAYYECPTMEVLDS